MIGKVSAPNAKRKKKGARTGELNESATYIRREKNGNSGELFAGHRGGTGKKNPTASTQKTRDTFS